MGIDKLTVGRWIEQWLKDEAPKTIRPRTLRDYEAIARRKLIPALGNINLHKLGASDISAYMARELKDGKSTRWIAYQHAVLRRALAVAERFGKVDRNVARLVSPPRSQPAEREPLTPDQARSFLAAAEGNRLSALYAMAMATGMRQGELLGLTWDAVDLDRGTATVRTALARYGGKYHLDAPKTERSRRIVALPEPVVALLRKHRVRQHEERLRAGSFWQGEQWNLVFCREDGAPLSGPVVTKAFQRLLDRAGLPQMRFHDLRHGAATYMLASGVPMRVVMEVLGHSQMATTADL